MQPRLTPRNAAILAASHERGYLNCAPGRHLRLVQNWWHERDAAELPIVMVFHGKKYAKLRWVAWIATWTLTEAGMDAIRAQVAEHGGKALILCENHAAIDRLPAAVAEQMAAQLNLWLCEARQRRQEGVQR